MASEAAHREAENRIAAARRCGERGVNRHGKRQGVSSNLKLLERQGKIAAWHDRLITAGQEWKGEIDRELEAADVILLLVRPASARRTSEGTPS